METYYITVKYFRFQYKCTTLNFYGEMKILIGFLYFQIGNGNLGLVGGLALSEDMIVVADMAVRIYDVEGNLRTTLAPVPKGN